MPESGRLFASIRTIASLTMASRILGVLRECAFGHFFATSELLSAFRIAFMAPNLARRLFGEGALSSALIPTLTADLQERGEEHSRRLVGTILSLMAVVLVGIVIAVELAIAAWRAWRDDPALELTAVLLPYMILICIVAVAGGVLNVRRHFATPAAMPILLNLCVIAGLLGGALWWDLQGLELMYAVCGGVLIGGVLQLIASGAALRAVAFFPVFGGRWRDPQVRAVFALMAPMILGLSAVQINSLADYLIAYLFVFKDGERIGPAVLGFAQYLYQFPLGVLGISLATAIFPMLSREAAEGGSERIAETVGRGIRLALFMALPAAVGLIFVAQPLVAALYEHGQFGPSETQRVAWVLVFYAIGLPAYFTHHVVVRTYYSMKDSRTPARVALIMVGVNLGLNLILVFRMEERGLALATAICATIQIVWLSVRLRRVVPTLAWRRIALGVAKSVIATAAMAVGLLVLNLPAIGDRLVALHPAIRLAVLVVAGVAVYAVVARLLRIEELSIALPKRRSRT